MSITTYDHNLSFLRMVLRASDFDLIKNGNPFAPPTDTRPTPRNDTGTYSQITEVVRLYKDEK